MEERQTGLLSDFTNEERFLLKKALSRLSCYDDTARGLCSRLSRMTYKGAAVGEESARKVVRFLAAQNLLREKEYAQDLVRAMQSRGYGTRRILTELSRKQFQKNIVEAVREGLSCEEEAEFSRAFSVLKNRAAARKSDLSDPQEKQRLYAFLARRGFSPDCVKRSLSKLSKKDEEDV